MGINAKNAGGQVTPEEPWCGLFDLFTRVHIERDMARQHNGNTSVERETQVTRGTMQPIGIRVRSDLTLGTGQEWVGLNNGGRLPFRSHCHRLECRVRTHCELKLHRRKLNLGRASGNGV